MSGSVSDSYYYYHHCDHSEGVPCRFSDMASSAVGCYKGRIWPGDQVSLPDSAFFIFYRHWFSPLRRVVTGEGAKA